MKQPSLTVQLLKGIGLPLVLVVALIGAIAYFSAIDEVNEVYDSQLITSANELWLLSEREDSRTEIKVGGHDLELDDSDQKALDEYARWRRFRVWRGGKLLLVSDNADGASDKPHAKGFTDVASASGDWRLFTLYVPRQDVVVEVGEKVEARYEVVWPILFGLLIPLLLAIPVFALVIWQGGRWGLRDLRRFAANIKQRSPDDLSRIPDEGAPAEIAPVAEALNSLLAKLDQALQQERLFTDNAAHELRTPLAALGLQTDVVRNARTRNERSLALGELDKGVERASRLLDQLLTLARIRHTPIERTELDLRTAAADAIKDIYPLALAKKIDLALSGDGDAAILSKKPLLAILLRNLLDNAIKYSPAGACVDVEITEAGGAPRLIVRDQGPGIPPDEREQVFAHFYRMPGAAGAGSGLGLAIVRTIADLLGIDVRLFTPESGTGLEVEVRFAPQKNYQNV